MTSFRTALLTGVLLALLAPVAAQAETHGRGYVPPPDWDRIQREHLRIFPVDKVDLPVVFDWRLLDGVTPAKDQGSCGSCWAFAATGEMEAKIRIYYNNRIMNLSEQQVISCNPYGAGCGGGWAGSAYWVFQHQGGVTEDCMPYEGSDFVPCTADAYHKFTTLDSWYSVANDVAQIKEAVLEGPVCTGIDASGEFEGYSGGGCIDGVGHGTNHLVLIVGWDDRACDYQGAWIIKNSWGPGWGDSGFGYVRYGALSIGTSVTALQYTPPPTDVRMTSPNPAELQYGGTPVTVGWSVFGDPVNSVDIWFGADGWCGDTLVAENVPASQGTYTWTLPNVSTSRATFLVFPSEGTQQGYALLSSGMTVVGHQTRYVSASGSNTFPYDTPAKAAHAIADGVLAGAGRDTVKIAGGDYFESVAVNSQCLLEGGWNANFTVHDPAATPTNLRSVSGALRFSSDAQEHCGVSDIIFHDCTASNTSVPVIGRHGAAIVALNASPRITDCTFVNNRANPTTEPGWGGAVLLHGGAPVVSNCTFTGNIGSLGGALAVSQSAGAVIEDCTFTGNATSDSTGTYLGGAVYIGGGTATLRGCALQGNGAGMGGAIDVADGAQFVLEDCDLVANRSRLGGGAVHESAGDLAATGGRWAQNISFGGHGGGLFVEDGAFTLRNLLIAGNSTTGLGGGIMSTGTTGGALENCVIMENAATQNVGGAMVFTSGAFVARNNIVTANSGGGLMITGASATSDYNLAWQNSPLDFLSAMGAHDMVADPRFADAAGGDYALGLHSPAVDSGDPDPACNDTDGSPADRGVFGGPAAATVAPPPITGAHLTDLGAGSWRVSWDASPATDVSRYVVYCDTASVFVPGANHVAAMVTAPDHEVVDTPAFAGCYYLVVAEDAAGHVGGYSARLVTDGSSVPVPDDALPRALAINGVVPNPFNPRTTVAFDVPRAGHVSLRIYDLRGHLVRDLLDGDMAAGSHQAVWDGTDAGGRAAAAGIYLVRLDDGQHVAAAKAVLAK